MKRPLSRTQITRAAHAAQRRESIERAGGKRVEITLDAANAARLDALATVHTDRRGLPSPSAAVAWLLAQWAGEESEK